MHGINDADRKAAEELRAALADISGFWYLPGDDGPICAALARYRAECEQRLIDKLGPLLAAGPRKEAEGVDLIAAPISENAQAPKPH